MSHNEIRFTNRRTAIRIEIPYSLLKSGIREISIGLSDACADSLAGQAEEDETHSFFRLLKERVRTMKRSGQLGTAENYECAANSFMRFRNGIDIMPDEITPDFIELYEQHLRKNGLKMNTVSFYMRILRAVYNKAVEDGLTADRKPFRRAYTGTETTRKRAVTIGTIRRIRDMKATTGVMELAKDMFMFSFYLRGMSMIDIAYLEKENLKNGILTYRRRKTGQTLKIKWEKCMQDIVDRHPSANGKYMLPLIKDLKKDDRKQYKNKQSEIQKQLIRISEKLRLKDNLTMYVARHSWASIAKSMNIPIGVISESMGHTSLKTTQIYLKEIDADVIDKANSKVIGAILQEKRG